MRKNGIGKFAKASVAAMLTIVLLIGIAGCSFFDKIQNKIDPRASILSGPELLRLIVDAINDDSKINDIYESIPENQRTDVSFSYFSYYISIIRQIEVGNSDVVEYEFLDSEANRAHLEKIYNKLCQVTPSATFEDTFEPFGDVRTVRLIREKEEDSDSYIYISFNENGDAYLSYAWIMNTIEVYSYMQHYFTMLTDDTTDISKKTEGISLLLKNKRGYANTYSDEIIEAKARYTVDFYSLKVRSNPDQFILRSINAFMIDYEIPEVYSTDGKTLYSRHVTAFRSIKSEIEIIDDIPQMIDNNVITVNVSQGQLIRCGLDYDSSAIQRLFGKPIKMTVLNDKISVKEDDEGVETVEKKIGLQYKGIYLVFDAYFTGDSNDWIGELISITLVQNSQVSYSVCDIRLGDTEESILKRFPMIEFGQYVLSYKSNSGKCDLEYKVKDGVITDITIKEADI